MPCPPHRSRSFSATFPSAVSGMARVRDDIRAWLDGVLDDDAAGDVLVIVSELIGNAIASCPPDTDVSVLLRQDGATTWIEVSNRGCTWVEPDDRWDLGDPLRTGGRGLLIVHALAEDVDIVQDEPADSTVIKVRYRSEPPAG